MSQIEHGPCTWAVRDGFERVRTCGRGGAGYQFSTILCWQHRRNLLAEVVKSQIASPDPELGEFLGELAKACAPTEYDSEEVTEHRKEIRVAFMRGLTRAIKWGAVKDDDAPYGINHALDDLVKERFDEMWGAEV